MRIRLIEVCITEGQSPSDRGVGYLFTAEGDKPCENVSFATNGYYQGCEREVVGILTDECTLEESAAGDMLAYPKARLNTIYGPLMPHSGLDAEQCIAMGLLVVKKNKEGDSEVWQSS